MGTPRVMDEREFYSELRREFPELLEELDDGISTGVLHLEMAELARLAQEAIAARDRENTVRCFAFAARAFETGTPSLKNAVAVSFLEHTVMEADSEAKREAEALLPVSLRGELKELREYWAVLDRRAAHPKRAEKARKRDKRPRDKRIQTTRAATARSRGPRR